MLDEAVPVRFAAPMTAAPVTAAEPRTAPRPRLPWPALIPAAAAAWWLLGHLPWLLDGLQPSWYAGTEAVELPAGTRLAVPLLTNTLADLLLYGLIGGVVAGLLVRLGSGPRWRAAVATLAGVALGLGLALAQCLLTLGDAPQGAFGADPRVVAGLAVAAVGAALAGWALGSCALLGRSGLAPALAVLAGALPSWLSALVTSLAPDGTVPTLGAAPEWAGAALLCLALVLTGLRPPIRALAWPVLVLLAWTVGAVVTAAVYLSPLLRPGAGLPGTLPESLRATGQVFTAVWSGEGRPLLPWLLAVAVALAIALAISLTQAGSRARADRQPSPTLVG